MTVARPVETFVKDPDEKLDYTVDWSRFLETQSIVSVIWTVPSGLTKGFDSFTPYNASVMLSGGTDGVSYDVTCHVLLSSAEEAERTIRIKVQQR